MDIEDSTRIKPATILSYLTGLTKAGYLKRIPGKKNTKNSQGCNIIERLSQWELINDIGVEAPRVTKTGKPVIQGNKRENMWRTMKVVKQFTSRQLAINATTESCKVGFADSKDYCRYLAYAGYLAVVKKGLGQQQTVYKFMKSKNTGPKPPMIQRIKQVFDPNLGEVVWKPGDKS